MDRVEVELIVSALAKNFGSVDAALKGMGAAGDKLTQTQNKLAAALAAAEISAKRLAEAHSQLNAATDPEEQAQFARDVAKAQAELDRQAQIARTLSAELDGLQAETSQTAKANAELAGASQKAGISLTELNSGLALAKQGYAALAGLIKAVIDPTIEYAKQVRDLSRTIGSSPEESSKLIQAADDVMVSYDTMTTAMEAAIRKGVDPSIDGLGRLADKYLAIEDPIARTKFLMDSFGRSGADMAPLMALGAKGIKALGDEAENTGLVLSKDLVDGAREFEKSTDALSDATAGYLTLLASRGIPILTEINNLLASGITLTNQLEVARREGALTDQEAASVSEAVKRGHFSVGEAAEYVAQKTEAMRAAQALAISGQKRFAESSKEVQGAMAAIPAALNSTGAYYADYTAEIEAATAASKALAAQQEAALSAAVAAGMSGTLTNAQAAYNAVFADTAPQIAKVRAELAKYEAQQGKTITITTAATVSQDEYELAAIKAAAAAQALADYTGDDREEYLKLSIAANKAQEAVVKLGEGFGTSRDITLDYTAKIGEANGTLAELEARQLAAEQALIRTTAQFLYQQIAAGLDAEAQLILARQLGLMDESSYEAATAALALKQAYEDGAVSAENMGVKAGELRDAIAKLQDKGVTITVTTIYNEIRQTRIREATEAAGGVYDPKSNEYLNLPGRAGGGPVAGGQAYVWNEAGAQGEILVPQGAGFVLNRKDAMAAVSGATGGSSRPNWTGDINVTGVNDPAHAAELVIRKLEDRGIINKARFR